MFTGPDFNLRRKGILLKNSQSYRYNSPGEGRTALKPDLNKLINKNSRVGKIKIMFIRY